MGADGPATKKQRIGVDDSNVRIRIGDKVQEHPQGVLVHEALGDTKAYCARLNNEVVPLAHRIVGSEITLESVPLESPDGIRVLIETLKLMLKIAKHDATPDLALTVGRPIGAAYYCMLTDIKTGAPHKPTEAELQKYRDAMSALIKEARPLKYSTVSTKQAIETLAKTGAGLTASIIRDCNKSQVTIVECKGLYHMPRYPVVLSTDMIAADSFKITSFKDGFFLEHFRCDTKTGKARHWQPDAGVDLLYNEYTARLEWTRAVGLYTIHDLNQAIRKGDQKKVIQATEANCDRQFVELAAQVKAHNNVKLLLIAGPSSSGKTTFAKRLQVQLEAYGYKPFVLSVDGFYKAWQDITSEGPQKVDWEALDSLNLAQLNDVLLTLMAGKEADIPEYDMKTSMPADKSHWTKAKIDTSRGMIIMEGIHCLNPALTPAVPKEQKFKIAIAPIPALQLDGVHVLSGTTIRMLRRMVRDYLNRGRPVLATLRQWPSVVAGEVNNIYPHQHNADVVMNSEIAYEMCVYKVHVEPLLKTVSSNEKEFSEVQRLLETLEQFTALPTNIIPPQSLLREFVGGSWYYDYGGWYKGY